MKKKSAIIIASVFLNLVLFSALVYYNKINSQTTEAATPFFRLQHLSATGILKNNSHEIVLASTVK